MNLPLPKIPGMPTIPGLDSILKNAEPTTINGEPPAPVQLPPPKYTPPDVQPRKNHEEIMGKAVESLVETERYMSPGGTQIQSYMNDLQVNVGGKFLTADIAPPVSVVHGSPVPSKVSIENTRTTVKQKNTPNVQSVAHSVPWGTYSIMACNKFNVVAGAGGILFQTAGCVDINGGGRTTISSLNELNLTSSEGNINIVGGHNITLNGDTVCIQTRNTTDQVVVNSNLGVAKNLTVHGSTYVDGELFIHHVTAPVCTRTTGAGPGSFGLLPSKEVVGYTDLSEFIEYINKFVDHVNKHIPTYAHWKGSNNWGVQTFANAPESKTEVQTLGSHNNDDPGKTLHVFPHKHEYYTINSTLHTGNGKIRDLAAADISDGTAGTAIEQVHGGFGLAEA